MTASGILRQGRRNQIIVLALAIAVVLLAVLGGIVLLTEDEGQPEQSSTEEAVAVGPPIHTENAAELDIPPGDPPAGGPHFSAAAPPGIHEEAIPDGAAIHSLEHGMVWISYNPQLVKRSDVDALRKVARDFPRTVILSPRPANARPVTVVSWGRILRLQSADIKMLRSFIQANVNRGPESEMP